jgi:hypothetical protein
MGVLGEDGGVVQVRHEHGPLKAVYGGVGPDDVIGAVDEWMCHTCGSILRTPQISTYTASALHQDARGGQKRVKRQTGATKRATGKS